MAVGPSQGAPDRPLGEPNLKHQLRNWLTCFGSSEQWPLRSQVIQALPVSSTVGVAWVLEKSQFENLKFDIKNLKLEI